MTQLPDHLCIADIERSAPTPSVVGSREMTRNERIIIGAWFPCTLVFVLATALSGVFS